MSDKLAGEQQTLAFRWIAIRSALGIEIRTGMKHSKGSILKILRDSGITEARTKKQAWLDLDKMLVESGLPAGRRPW